MSRFNNFQIQSVIGSFGGFAAKAGAFFIVPSTASVICFFLLVICCGYISHGTPQFIYFNYNNYIVTINCGPLIVVLICLVVAFIFLVYCLSFISGVGNKFLAGFCILTVFLVLVIKYSYSEYIVIKEITVLDTYRGKGLFSTLIYDGWVFRCHYKLSLAECQLIFKAVLMDPTLYLSGRVERLLFSWPLGLDEMSSNISGFLIQNRDAEASDYIMKLQKELLKNRMAFSDGVGFMTIICSYAVILLLAYGAANIK